MSDTQTPPPLSRTLRDPPPAYSIFGGLGRRHTSSGELEMGGMGSSQKRNTDLAGQVSHLRRLQRTSPPYYPNCYAWVGATYVGVLHRSILRRHRMCNCCYQAGLKDNSSDNDQSFVPPENFRLR
jgi:hypothetical protein